MAEGVEHVTPAGLDAAPPRGKLNLVVNLRDTRDQTFAALADPTRRAILERLATGNATVGELAEPFDMSLVGVYKHVRALERAGLVITAREGRVRRCRLGSAALH